MRPPIGRAAAALVVMLTASSALAQALQFGPHDVTSLFSITKSENKNEVVFAEHLDEHCNPIGSAPIYAFWRMKEKGPAVIEPLLGREEKAYGIATQRVVARESDGSSVDLTLRAMPGRRIRVKVQRKDGICVAWSSLSIAGVEANLYNVYVKLQFLGVDFILLSGWTLDGTRVVRERVER